uniref:DDE_Tnp_IS1595 domain-containing protein n=1 Tax=Anopheles funestus TaxID=62324 RepID=A0A182RWX4_ANOFN
MIYPQGKCVPILEIVASTTPSFNIRVVPGFCITRAESGVSRKTVNKWFRVLRAKSKEYLDEHRDIVGGRGMTVEIDESVLTKRKYNRGRLSANNQVWAVGGICRENKIFFLELVEKRDRATLHDIILENVAPETIITTDRRAYNGLETYGYEHRTVNHSQNFVDPGDWEIHTQGIEILWGKLKPYLRRKGTHKASIDSYVREFEFKRHNPNVFATIIEALKAE